METRDQLCVQMEIEGRVQRQKPTSNASTHD